MTRTGVITALALTGFLAATCGGKQGKGGTGPGDTHVGDDLDIDEGGTAAGNDGGVGEMGETDGGTEVVGELPAGEEPAVTFELVNTAEEDLVFSLDRGWQPVISAYSGKPPNAKAILMFPTHCTAACEVDEAERCPVCEKAKDAKEERESEQRKFVPAGKSLKVVWDGQVYLYERTKGLIDGKKKKCNCYRKEEVAPNEYTVRACGLRITKSAKRTSAYQCPTATMTLPGDGPQTVRFEFGEPEHKKTH